ncbi:MAG: PIG-L family deacetylase [Pseudonocardiaceae bacterium]
MLAVHAHPDDESITTGGLLARCAESEVTTILLMCTDGRYGPVNPDLGLQLTPDQLADMRAAELDEAARILDVTEIRRLGHHDSNMTGLPENNAPKAFWAQPTDELVATVVRLVRECRPHVVVTYDPFGNTGHPDHVQAHRVTMLAVAAASEARCFPETGAVWSVQQVFHPVYPVSSLRRFVDEELQAGRPHPFEGRDVAEIDYGRPDSDVTHRVDIGDEHKRKTRALHAHLTQIGPHYPQLYRVALARREHEHFRLAWQRDPRGGFEDIFEPVAR